jgi:hypothetical protein
LFASVFEDRSSTTNAGNPYYKEAISLYVGYTRPGVEREYLTYSIICCYIRYDEPRGYGVLELEVGYLGIYAIKYYYRLECDYRDYFHCH